MKLFGEFLVEKKYINADNLVHSLISQVKMTRPVVDIIYSKKLLDPNQILSALQLQASKNMEFITACKEMNLWTDDIESEVHKEASKGRPPIGQILIRDGYIESKKLIEALDEYMVYRLDQLKEGAEQPEIQATQKNTDAEAKTSESILNLDSGEFLDFFNNSQYVDYETQLFSLEPERTDFSDSAQDVLSAFMILRGYYDTLNMNQSKVIAEYITVGLSQIIEKGAAINQEIIWEYKALAKSVLDLLWRVREQLDKGSSEASAYQEPGNKNGLESITKDWNEFNKKLK